MYMNDADRARIAAAITDAEKTTDGEIVTILADQSDAYHDVALHWALLAAFLALAVIAAWPLFFLGCLDRVTGWSAGHSPRALLTILLVILAAKFLVARLLLAWRPLRLALTPGATKARRVRRRAVLLFKAGTERRTATRTGVLLYLSLAEHRAEIVVDETIHAKVPPESWGAAMAALIDAVRDGRPGDGMVAAVGTIGAVLAKALPFTGTDPNELPDRLIEL
jgi:putative membrane protein